MCGIEMLYSRDQMRLASASRFLSRKLLVTVNFLSLLQGKLFFVENG